MSKKILIGLSLIVMYFVITGLGFISSVFSLLQESFKISSIENHSSTLSFFGSPMNSDYLLLISLSGLALLSLVVTLIGLWKKDSEPQT